MAHKKDSFQGFFFFFAFLQGGSISCSIMFTDFDCIVAFISVL